MEGHFRHDCQSNQIRHLYVTRLTVSCETTTFEWDTETITAVRFGRVVGLWGEAPDNGSLTPATIPERYRPSATIVCVIDGQRYVTASPAGFLSCPSGGSIVFNLTYIAADA